MKIEIEVSDHYAKVLSRWASVGRTMTTAMRACMAASDGDEITDTDREMFRICGDEISELMPSLDHLHHQARQAMWNIANREKAVAELEKTDLAHRKVAILIMKAASNPQYIDTFNAICNTLRVSRTLWPEAVIDWLRKEAGDA